MYASDHMEDVKNRFRRLPHLIVMNPSEGRDTGMCVADSALTYH